MSGNIKDIQALLDKANKAVKTSSYEESGALFANAQEELCPGGNHLDAINASNG